MKRRIFHRLFQIAIIFILISACAKMSTPSGGKKDSTPPVVIKSVPVNRAKNFKGRKLEITFDEYIALDNINDKFMISPPMKKKPKVFTRGKNVITEFEEELKDSTTYTLYFQDAIKDLNEGNKIQNYQFVFSTGPVIDSLSVTGNVYNSLDLEVPEMVQVLMYRELADSAVEKHIPDYISKLDKGGYFRINNVSPGKYRLYALKDVDNSKNYNLREEEFAFMDSTIEVTTEKNFIPVVKDTATLKQDVKKAAESLVKDKSTIKKEEKKVAEIPALKGEYQLILFAALKKNHYLTSSTRKIMYQLIYTLSLPPDSMKFEFSIPGTADSSYLLERSRKNDTLKVWLSDSSLYSMPQITSIVKYPLTDTMGMEGYKTDTIKMRYITPRVPKTGKVKAPPFKVETNIIAGFLKPGQKIVLKALTPLREPDTSRIRLYDVTDTIKKIIVYNLHKDSTNACRYILNANLKLGKKYLYIADSASYNDIYNQHTDSTGIKFSVKDPASYSKLTLNITDSVSVVDKIIQLLDIKENLISEKHISKNGKLLFPLLDVGIYRVRAIIDLNGDGYWTTGDFATGRQPEPVLYYPTEIEIKKDWELDQDWVMLAMNFKDQKLRKKIITKP